MARQAMIIDMNRCVGCGACVIACQEEWGLPDAVSRNWVRPMPPSSSRSPLVFTHYVGMCGHCEDAPCLDVCPVGATRRDEKGRVVIDSGACIGCGYCVETCPFSARMYNEETGCAEKCDFCAARVDAGKEPACVATCPADARIFGDLEDEESAVSRYRETHRVDRIETGEVKTRPGVYYAGEKEVVDQIFSSNLPDPAKMKAPLEGRILENAVRPGALGVIGLFATGSAISFVRQVTKGKRKDAEEGEAAPKLKRHDRPVIALHWFNAIVWFLQLVTGLGMLGGSRYHLTPGFVSDGLLFVFGSRQAMVRTHVVLGVAWLAVLLLFGIIGLRRYLIPFLRELALRRDDLGWLRLKPREMLSSSRVDLPPQGKYNAGQKLFGIGISALVVLIAASGLVINLAPGSGELIRWALTIHLAAAMAAVALLVLHVYMTVLNPDERPALRSMFTGDISERYARESNRLWWEERGSR